MILNVVALLLVLAITFMHSIFGFFSGLLNVFCSIVALVLAFGFFEPLTGFITGQFGLSTAYTEPICLVTIFIVSLALLRYGADNGIRGNVRLPRAVDVGGAIVCAFINAQIAVGVLVIGVLMLPVGGEVLGFARYERVAERDPSQPAVARFERRSLWFKSDEFAIGLFSMLSGKSLKGSTPFASVYPDFADAIFYSTNTVQPESTPAALRGSKPSDDGFKGLKVVTWWEQHDEVNGRYRDGVPTPRNMPPLKPVDYKPAQGNKLIGARITLGRAAADRVDRGQTLHLFRPSMIRLVGMNGDRPAQHVARVIGNADDKIQGANRVADLDTNFSIADAEKTIEVYFEVDRDFTPRFVEYRRHARAPLLRGELAEAPPSDQLEFTAASGGDDASASRSGGGSGARTFGTWFDSGSGQARRLPFGFDRAALARQSEVTLSAEGFVKGRFSGSRERLGAQRKDPVVEDFALPADQRLLLVMYRPKEARTVVGDVFNYVARLNQYRVLDEFGNQRHLCGYYAKVTRGGGEYVELFFNGPESDPYDPGYKAMLDFKDVSKTELEADDAVIGLYFLVLPGNRIVRVENQSGDGADVRFSIQ